MNLGDRFLRQILGQVDAADRSSGRCGHRRYGDGIVRCHDSSRFSASSLGDRPALRGRPRNRPLTCQGAIKPRISLVDSTLPPLPVNCGADVRNVVLLAPKLVPIPWRHGRIAPFEAGTPCAIAREAAPVRNRFRALQPVARLGVGCAVSGARAGYQSISSPWRRIWRTIRP